MTRTYRDMTGRTVEINYPPRRIVSLVPSQTELLYELGLNEEVAGITKFCVHPEEWFRNKKRVGGTKTVHIDIVKALQPGLILANKEENTKDQIEELAAMFPVWVSDIHTVEDALHMIQAVGNITGRATKAEKLLTTIQQGFTSLTQAAESRKNKAPLRVAYFIWRQPWMCAGGDTFISDMIHRAGWINVLADVARYPEIALQDLADKKVNMVLLSSEPYPFKEKHIAEIKAILPDAEVKLADGEMFSWYGSRMRLAPDYIKKLIGYNYVQ